MSKPSSWRELLGQVISNPAERGRIAAEIDVRPITLTRWTSGISVPRLQNLQQLLQALPYQQRGTFLQLLEEDGIHLQESPLNGASQEFPTEISSAFFNEIHETRANTPDALRFWTIRRQVLQHAIKQFDISLTGIFISIVECMVPMNDGIVRSLRERINVGTSPWPEEVAYRALFLGVETLAGYVVSYGRHAEIQDLREKGSFLPFYQAEYEISSAACPIQYGGRIAGSILVSSTQPGYFLSPSRVALVRSYANLLALAFEPEQFYPQEAIQLSLLPPPSVQQPYFQKFRQRVSEVMQEGARARRLMTAVQAEEIVWREVEEVLLSLV